MRSAIRKRLIELFTTSDQDFVSSQQICDELGCSRTAVWKHIEDLRKEGYGEASGEKDTACFVNRTKLVRMKFFLVWKQRVLAGTYTFKKKSLQLS